MFELIGKFLSRLFSTADLALDAVDNVAHTVVNLTEVARNTSEDFKNESLEKRNARLNKYEDLVNEEITDTVEVVEEVKK